MANALRKRYADRNKSEVSSVSLWLARPRITRALKTPRRAQVIRRGEYCSRRDNFYLSCLGGQPESGYVHPRRRGSGPRPFPGSAIRADVIAHVEKAIVNLLADQHAVQTQLCGQLKNQLRAAATEYAEERAAQIAKLKTSATTADATHQ